MIEEQGDYITEAMEMMGKGYEHPETPEGFNSPNYTQSPNDFYDCYLRKIDTLAELKVVSAFIRFTFGYHRSIFKMGIKELAEYTGLSENSVRTGAEAAERRKLLRRINPTEKKKAEWEMRIQEPAKFEGSKFEGQNAQSLKVRPAKSEPQVGVKERIKESGKEKEEEEAAKLKTIVTAYEAEIGMRTGMIDDFLKDAADTYPLRWTLDAIREAAAQNKRSWKYVQAILNRWQAQGNQEPMQKGGGAPPQRPGKGNGRYTGSAFADYLNGGE